MSIREIVKLVKEQTGVRIVFSSQALQEDAFISLHFVHQPLEQLINRLLQNKNLPWIYNPTERRVEISSASSKKEPPMISTGSTVSGRAFSSAGIALPGVTVQLKGTTKTTVSANDGLFSFNGVPANSILVFSLVGYTQQELPLKHHSFERVVLEAEDRMLDGAVVQAYGLTSRRTVVGNITKIKVKDLAQQPVMHPFNALHDRVAGLLVTQLNGSPGGGSSFLIRGRTSLGTVEERSPNLGMNTPLVLLNDVPFPATGTTVTTTGDFTRALNTGLSSFACLNLDDIESIEVLKDADATAIYGSRGGNGVILLTSKRGQSGDTRIHLSAKAGFNQLNNKMKLADTRQYLRLRRAAFINDTLLPTHYDFTVYDTNSYNNLTSQLLERPSYMVNAQFSMSGGNANTQFYLGAGYARETTTYTRPPGESPFGASRPSFHLSFDHHTGKLRLAFSGTYGGFKNVLAGNDPFQTPNFYPPHYPAFLDQAGNLTTSYNGIPLSNGIATFFNTYKAAADYLSANITLTYQLLPQLSLKTAVGHSSYRTEESLLLPQKARPSYSREPNSGIMKNASINIALFEPQLEYERRIGPGKLLALAGASWQRNTRSDITVSAKGFTPDNTDGFLSSSKKEYDHKAGGYAYQALFGRINYNIRNKYIFNLSGRRDGSSRFAPGKRFSMFGAAGVAYVFYPPFLSFGKLRASYGTNGNDYVGDNQYLATFTSTPAYQEQNSLQPVTPFNDDYSWEKSTKSEVGIDLGFLKNRIFLGLACYQIRTGNQLVTDKLPSQTGFVSVLQNVPALVQNRGIELELNTVNTTAGPFKWTSNLTFSINQNKLLRFPNLEQSAFAQDLAINEPVTVARGYVLLGVDPVTGIYVFNDEDGNGKRDKNDYRTHSNNAPDFYGGLGNDLEYKSWKLSCFLSFRKQRGVNFLKEYALSGSGSNPPVEALDYWEKPGDHASLQKPTQANSGPAYDAAAYYLPKSNAAYSDASFIRVRNIRLSWQLPQTCLSRWKMQAASVFVQAQNYFTITSYKGPDPESPGFKTIPPLKTIAAGITVSF